MSNNVLQSADPHTKPTTIADEAGRLPNATTAISKSTLAVAPDRKRPVHDCLPHANDRLGTALIRLKTADQRPLQSASSNTPDVRSATAPADRRLFPRHQSSYTVSVWSNTDEASPANQPNSVFRGELIDMSLNGIALKLPKPLQPRHSICLKMRNPVTLRELEVGAQVVRCLPSKSQEWKVVCYFNRHLSIEQLAQFTGTSHVSDR
ncbi:MAG: PilZ domain-containing protein [Planctomycetaceae bacterium]